MVSYSESNFASWNKTSKSYQDSKPGEIDLHGLYVKEAIAHTDNAIEQAKRKGDTEVHLIVGTYDTLLNVDGFPFTLLTTIIRAGKGLHSQGGIAKIKPAIEELMQKSVVLISS